MNDTLTDKLAASREIIKSFGRHYDYDVSYLEELMDASPGAFQAFEASMPMGRYRLAAPLDLITIAKITATRTEDCGPCTELGIKMAREAQVPDALIRGVLRGGEGLTGDQLDVYHYAHAVADNEDLDLELLSRLQDRLGREAVAELAVVIVAARLYPTLKRAMGHAKSCSLMPSLLS